MIRKTLVAALVLLGGSFAAQAEDAPPPPYLMTGMNSVAIAVAYDPASVDALLPKGLKAAEGYTGGVNIYTASGGFGLTPYSAGYMYVEVEGFVSSSGAKARYVFDSVYGPDPKVAKALEEHYDFTVSPGSSEQKAGDGTMSATASLGGKALFTNTIKPKSGDCPVIAGDVNYVQSDGKGGWTVLPIPFAGAFCLGEAVKVEVTAPANSTFSKLKIDKMLAGFQLKDTAFAFGAPLAQK